MADTTAPRTSTSASAPAQKAAATRKKNAVKRSATKAAETRAANRGSAARAATARKTRATAARGGTAAAKAKQEIKSPIGRATEIAERAMLVPVGAALIVRDKVAATIDDLRAAYSTRTKATQELRRFERRGSSAVTRVARDAKTARTRLERELRSVVKDIETRADPLMKNVELVGARVEYAVQRGRTGATRASTKVQERTAALA
jgi:hypothetical protein